MKKKKYIWYGEGYLNGRAWSDPNMEPFHWHEPDRSRLIVEKREKRSDKITNNPSGIQREAPDLN